jgi:hypothetical protein
MLILKIIYGMARQLGLIQHHLDCRQTVGSREKKRHSRNEKEKERKANLIQKVH